MARYMVPDAPLYYTAPEPLAESDVKAASLDYMKRWQRFYRLMGEDRKEHETWRMLSWCQFQDALFMARRGDREGARQAVKMGLAMNSKALELTDLAEALKGDEKGPLDITPFLTGSPNTPSNH